MSSLCLRILYDTGTNGRRRKRERQRKRKRSHTYGALATQKHQRITTHFSYLLIHYAPSQSALYPIYCPYSILTINP